MKSPDSFDTDDHTDDEDDTPEYDQRFEDYSVHFLLACVDQLSPKLH